MINYYETMLKKRRGSDNARRSDDEEGFNEEMKNDEIDRYLQHNLPS
jgi:hypothetical protein